MNPPRRSPRIGFIVDWLEHSYQSMVLRGAAQIISDRGGELIALPGGMVDGDAENGRRRNRLYQFITPESFDALIVMTGTLCNVRGMDVLQEICPGFPRGRVCHVGIPAEDASAVLVDNETGMRRIVEHLIDHHSHRRIAFVRGPVANAEAQTRYGAYRRVLEARGIPLDERLVIQGGFQLSLARAAVRELFEERGISKDELDAIVCAADIMALGVLEELKELGVDVPTDVAVVGFDDIEEARQASPPLSTVRQPLLEQGRVAAELVLASLRTGAGPIVSRLDTESFFRRSCGCTAEDPGAITERPKADTRMSLEASLSRRRDNVLEEMRRAAAGAFDSVSPRWAEDLFSALVSVFGGQPEAFRKSYDSLLERLVAQGGDVALGNAMITALRKQLSICAGDDPHQLRQLEGVLHDARILTADAIFRAQGQRRVAAERATRAWSTLSVQLSRPSSRPLGERLREALPRVGIQAAYICRYDAAPGLAALVAGFDDAGVISERLVGVPFAQEDVFPTGVGGASGHRVWVVEPLIAEDVQWGFAVVALAQSEGFTLEILQRVLSHVLA